MNQTLQKLKNIRSANCITIILNTHRTMPANQQDAILLKNLIKEAEQRLLATNEKHKATLLIQRMHDLASTIDHRQNLESLILFVNENIAEFIRLPVVVENRVIIDDTFATRDLIRALHMQTAYYVLVLSQKKARVLEAFNDKFVAEDENHFPIENTQWFSTTKAELANAPRQTNLIGEFFNRIDKEVNKIVNVNPLPVLLCAEQANVFEYKKVANNKNIYLDIFLNRNRVDEKAIHIVDDAWKIMKKYTEEKNNRRISELKQAVDSGKFLSDLNDIWMAIPEGRIQTFFVEQNLFQPAIIKNGKIIPVDATIMTEQEVIDDIFDEIIEQVIKYGGEVVFLPHKFLKDFQGFGAITRF